MQVAFVRKSTMPVRISDRSGRDCRLTCRRSLNTMELSPKLRPILTRQGSIMFGVIAWIRADGRKALVVVEGSALMAVGDPGRTTGSSFKVGDLVQLPGLTADKSAFMPGLRMVRPDYWPQIGREIERMAVARAADARRDDNVITLFARRPATPPRGGNPRRRIVAAE